MSKYTSWGWFQADNGRYGIMLYWASGGREYNHGITPSPKDRKAIQKAWRKMEFMKFQNLLLSEMPVYIKQQLIEKADINLTAD